MPRIEYTCECEHCKGTGIYKGWGEQEDIGVVCRTCDGKGKLDIVREYTEFTERKVRDDVHRVIQINPGYQAVMLDDYAIPYDHWLDGMPFPSEMRSVTCPCWWYQLTDNHKRPNWQECGFGTFTSCRHFGEKTECWARFDEERKP